jgi:hypothetical protein
MGFKSIHRSRAHRNTLMLSSALGLTVVLFLNSVPVFAAAPVLSEDPTVIECSGATCQRPEYSPGNRVWVCPGAEEGQACPVGEKCSITLAKAGEEGAIETTDPDKKFIKCTCRRRGEGDGPVSAPPPSGSGELEAVSY